MGIASGRHTARIEGDFVVFLIGFHVNRPLHVHRWAPVMTAMQPMIRELREQPERGLLASHLGWMFGGFAYVQYWRSFEQLEAYARATDAEHLPAWRRFNQRIRGTDAVGVYHETYRVRAGEYEAMYVDMPRTGITAIPGAHAPVGSTSTAARRLGLQDDAGAPVAP